MVFQKASQKQNTKTWQFYEFWYICNMSSMTAEQKKRLLKAKVAGALQNELGRVPKEEEIEQVTLLARVLYMWWCHGCLRGGDVVRLARMVWGYHPNEEAMAAADLLREFGHEVPSRPASWFAKQRRQKPARDALEEAKILHVQRRVFRCFVPFIEAIEDEAERLEETELMWEAAGEIAALILAGREAA